MKKRKITLKEYIRSVREEEEERFLDEQLAEFKINERQLLDEIFKLFKNNMIGVTEKKDDCILYRFIGDKFKITVEKLPEK